MHRDGDKGYLAMCVSGRKATSVACGSVPSLCKHDGCPVSWPHDFPLIRWRMLRVVRSISALRKEIDR